MVTITQITLYYIGKKALNALDWCTLRHFVMIDMCLIAVRDTVQSPETRFNHSTSDQLCLYSRHALVM